MFERTLMILSLAVFMLGGCQSFDTDRVSEDHTVILVTPNLDDDDGDGEPDAADDIINGPLDRDDLTVVHVPGTVYAVLALLAVPTQFKSRTFSSQRTKWSCGTNCSSEI